MGRTISDHELRNNSSAMLHDVQAGETIAVTNNGEVVAVLVPPPLRPGAVLPIQRAAVKGGFADLPRVQLDHPLKDDLDDLRGDR
ncbi:type II toxin-antitoxin system Phd/YefM family antitoxin [Pseudonocardia alaniniphila]|uniref:Antitoxin n=1 Tax=Pseudonocardia alaniniphila TaxID=75291 RepID=A0ABS9TMX7_9PSEU|nr:type II toxin-antitoxin system prevent-host-death family antitoxin [Pseudonocardia alaniniphila]MCH6169753.1 type II toxin-antitoxin system prevent-host-death family antitoxin [Pseudonocardia alaniniphila]